MNASGYFSAESENSSWKIHRLAESEDKFTGGRNHFTAHPSPKINDNSKRYVRLKFFSSMCLAGRGLWHHLGYLLVLIWLIPGAFACKHLLNSKWTPKSLGERTDDAKIVVSVYTRQTFKAATRPANELYTYSAEFRILKVLKGGDLLKTVSTPAPGWGGERPDLPELGEPLNTPLIHNISNFGDKSDCYSDVSQGEYYILFLTTYKGRLSARYNDFFSAAAELTAENEQLVLEAIGKF